MYYVYYDNDYEFDIETIDNYNVRILKIKDKEYQIFFKASKSPDILRAINRIKKDHDIKITSHTFAYSNSNWYVHILCEGKINREKINGPELQ